jgi:hypothetical protein
MEVKEAWLAQPRPSIRSDELKAGLDAEPKMRRLELWDVSNLKLVLILEPGLWLIRV